MASRFARGGSTSLRQVRQRYVVEHRLGKRLLLPGIPGREQLKAPGLGYLLPALHRFPFVEHCRVGPRRLWGAGVDPPAVSYRPPKETRALTPNSRGAVTAMVRYSETYWMFPVLVFICARIGAEP